MTTREQAWIHAQEQPDDILITGKMKRDSNRMKPATREELNEKFGESAVTENIRFESMSEADKDALNYQYLSKHGL